MNKNIRERTERPQRILFALITLILVTLALRIYTQKTATVSAEGRMSVTLPTDQPKNMPSFGNTPTPNGTDIANNILKYANTKFPTNMPIVISKVIDLSPELTDDEKYVVDVRHSDGTIDEYLVGPADTHDNFTLVLPDIVQAKLNAVLKPGDSIFGYYSILVKKSTSNQPPARSTYTISPGDNQIAARSTPESYPGPASQP